MNSFDDNKPESYGSLLKPYYGIYKNGYLNNAKSNPYRYSQQSDKLSFYAGNSWGVASNDRPRLPMTSYYRVPNTGYFPKQPAIQFEEIVDGDDSDKGGYGGNNNQYQENESFTQRFIPVMKSEATEFEDDDDDDDSNDPVDDVLQRKTHIPKHS